VARGVATLTIDRPAARNALAPRTMAELDHALDDLMSRRPRVLVIRGAGDKAFCAGGDLKELETMRSAQHAAAMAQQMRGTLDRLTTLKIPVIAAINGDAFGGGMELALACDFRVAAAHARIGLTQIKLGLMPAWGAAERLAAMVGRGRALHILLDGAVMTAAEAMRAGLLEEVVPSENFEARINDLARGIAAAPPVAVAGIKRSIDAVRSHRNPETAASGIASFTKAWTAPSHWKAVQEMERKRASRK
jgi:enoyl-CoA hydratase/carnithine racemase